MNDTMTEQERAIIKTRTEEAIQFVEQNKSVTDGLCEYMKSNGYHTKEAVALLEQVVSTIDQYHKDCFACMKLSETEQTEWILDRISTRVEDLTLAEECKYKVSILLAFRSMHQDILSNIGKQSEEQMADTYQKLEDDTLLYIDDTTATPQLLEQLNEQLAQAISESGMELVLTETMETLIEGNMDEEHIHGFVTELWKDEQYKYCACVAACVAKKNHELPSIPEDTTNENLIVGICQGMDTANIYMKVSAGELTADKAYQILKVIGCVGMAIVTTALLLVGGVLIADVAMGAISTVFGQGIVSTTVALALGGVILFGIGSGFTDIIKTVTTTFTKAADFGYDTLKQCAKKMSNMARETVLPTLQYLGTRIMMYIKELDSRVHHSIKCNKAYIEQM